MAPALKPPSVRVRMRSAPSRATSASSASRRASRRCFSARMRWRATCASSCASVACSRASWLLRSGESSTASRSPLRTLSPARILSVTVLAAGEYSVGLTAATTRPLTDASRTSVPRVTSAMRRREMSTERELPSQPDSRNTIAARPARPPPIHSRRRREPPVAAVAMTRSCPEVSLIMAWQRPAVGSGFFQQEPCQPANH